MHINTTKSGVIEGVGMNKLKIAVDGGDRTAVEGAEARKLAQAEAVRRGFVNGGLCETPQTGPIGPDGELLDGADALNPNLQLQGYRTEFTYAQRM